MASKRKNVAQDVNVQDVECVVETSVVTPTEQNTKPKTAHNVLLSIPISRYQEIEKAAREAYRPVTRHLLMLLEIGQEELNRRSNASKQAP